MADIIQTQREKKTTKRKIVPSNRHREMKMNRTAGRKAILCSFLSDQKECLDIFHSKKPHTHTNTHTDVHQYNAATDPNL